MKKKWILPVILLCLLAVAAGLNIRRIEGWYRSMSYGWSEHTPAEQKVKEYADRYGYAYGDYPASLIELLERNPETEQFVLEYPGHEKKSVDLSAYDPSQGVPLFLQWDQQWGYERYGSDVIGITGCGPTCLAMVGYYLTGEERFDPAQVAAFSEENGYYSKGNGSKWALMSEGAGKLGLQVKELPLVEKKITDQLQAGHPVILSVGKGDFTTSGHYIVLTGVEDGQFRVNDPNSCANSEKLWSYEQLEKQIRNIWAFWV